ncbi:hypothetical protein [Polynucleobacter sp. MWH-UH24A]|uniref:hypothetical protein n=1 Tax=Polynucleobacter sp. MWH-UH24A TaxID=2689110 RepID=UPI001BFEB075|nr:hypothetical protein [Polynucleobacter sp. MWH-UH24A]
MSQTYRLIQNHFTHIDDISVAYRFTKEDFFNRACSSNMSKPAGIVIYKITGENRERFCKLYYYAYIYTVIPRNFTYAPFQFWFTQAFLKPENSYSYIETKLQGRLPSFIFHILGIILFLVFIQKKLPGLKDEKLIPFILILIAAFSLEQRIMASQMHSYAIGILSNVCAIYGIVRTQNFFSFSKKQLFYNGLILALSVTMQYQAIFLVSAGLLATALIHLNRQNFNERIKKYFFLWAFFIISLGLTGAIIIIRYNSGINWNAGPNAEFIITSTDFFNRISTFFKLVFYESSYNFYSILSAIEFESMQAANFFGASLLLVCLLGFFYLYQKRNQYDYKIYFYTIFFYILLYFTLIFLGKLSYSPTRHFLFFLPIILILIGYGLIFIKAKINNLIFYIFLIPTTLIYACFSILMFSSFEEKRKDLIQVFNIPLLFQNSGATEILVDEFDVEPFFLTELSNITIFRYRPNPICKDYPYLSSNNLPKKFIIFWYSKRVLLNNQGAPLVKNFYDGGPISLTDYFQKVLISCFPHENIQNKTIQVKKISDILIQRSTIEIDLSNRTKNGSNSLFLQTFEIQLPTMELK